MPEEIQLAAIFLNKGITIGARVPSDQAAQVASTLYLKTGDKFKVRPSKSTPGHSSICLVQEDGHTQTYASIEELRAKLVVLRDKGVKVNITELTSPGEGDRDRDVAPTGL